MHLLNSTGLLERAVFSLSLVGPLDFLLADSLIILADASQHLQLRKSFPCILKLCVGGRYNYRRWQCAQILSQLGFFGTGRICKELTDI